MQHPVCSTVPSRSRQSVAQLLGRAESILKPLLGAQPGSLSRLEAGDNAMTFEFSGVGRLFRPKSCQVLGDFRHEGGDTHGEFEHYFVLEVQGHLVRMSVYFRETSLQGKVHGAIYTGADPQGAREQALKHLARLKA